MVNMLLVSFWTLQTPSILLTIKLKAVHFRGSGVT